MPGLRETLEAATPGRKTNHKGDGMPAHTPIELDARTVASALRTDTYTLALMLSEWARLEMTSTAGYMDFTKAGGPFDLDEFDEFVAKARAYYSDAWAAYNAWEQDNPPDAEDAE